MDENWLMRPLKGLGELAFHESLAAPGFGSAVFGPIESTGPAAISDALAEDTFRMPGMHFPEKGNAEMIAAKWTNHQVSPPAAIAGLRKLSDGLISFLACYAGWSVHVGPETGPFPAIAKLSDAETATSLTEIEGSLWLATLDGVFRIEPEWPNRITKRPTECWASVAGRDAVFVVQSDGILRLSCTDQRLIPTPVF